MRPGWQWANLFGIIKLIVYWMTPWSGFCCCCFGGCIIGCVSWKGKWLVVVDIQSVGSCGGGGRTQKPLGSAGFSLFMSAN